MTVTLIVGIVPRAHRPIEVKSQAQRWALQEGVTVVAEQQVWFLESIAADGSHPKQYIGRLPFRIGREPEGNDLVVLALGLSRQHAEITSDGAGGLRVTDLGSTNGTFVNRERILGLTPLADKDVIHFGNAEYRLGSVTQTLMDLGAPTMSETIVSPGMRQMLSEKFVRHEPQFNELLQGKGLAAAVQPIVRSRDSSLFAYELLGRCKHPGLSPSPAHLFHLAKLLDREAELSAAFLNYGVEKASPRLNGMLLFVNAHPAETFSDDFFASLQRLRAAPGAPTLVVEVAESAVVEIGRMRDFAARLAEIGLSFAYDDFGAGQARLVELGEVPARFVKFDMSLVHDIHLAPERKQRVVRELVRLVMDLGSVPLAEGIELEEEAELCRDMGFKLIQGYLTGRPQAVETL